MTPSSASELEAAKPTARKLDSVAENACAAFWEWVRVNREEDGDIEADAFDRACEQMNRLTGVVEARTGHVV